MEKVCGGLEGNIPAGSKIPRNPRQPIWHAGIGRANPSDPHESLSIHVVQKTPGATQGIEKSWTIAMLLLL